MECCSTEQAATARSGRPVTTVWGDGAANRRLSEGGGGATELDPLTMQPVITGPKGSLPDLADSLSALRKAVAAVERHAKKLTQEVNAARANGPSSQPEPEPADGPKPSGSYSSADKVKKEMRQSKSTVEARKQSVEALETTVEKKSRNTVFDSALPEEEQDSVVDKEMMELEKKDAKKQNDLHQKLKMKMGVSAKGIDEREVAAALKEKDDDLSKARYQMHLVLNNQRFDMAIGVVIVINSLTIGAEIQTELMNRSTLLYAILEYVYTFIYTVELGLRFFVYGAACLVSDWVKFDFFLVVISFFGLFGEPIMKFLADGDGASNALGAIMILKIFRFARLLRAVRLVSAFRELWALVRGLLASVKLMFHALSLLCMICYVYSCLGCELITKEKEGYDELGQDIIDQFFPNMFVFMLTLIQLITFDSAGAIYAEIIKTRPMMALFFVSFFIFVSIALMNLVTAIIVEGSFAQTKEDQEVQQMVRTEMMKKRLPRLLEVFKTLDHDGSGDISLEEVKAAPDFVKQELNKIIIADDLEELYQILDEGGDDSVGVDEFFDGIMRIGSGRIDMNTLRIQKQLNHIVKTFESEFEALHDNVMKIDGMLVKSAYNMQQGII
jgi:voltage-gated sodium channel